MTVTVVDWRRLVGQAEVQLQAAAVDQPRFDAELLLAAALGTTRPQLIAGLAPVPSTAALEQFDAWVARRVRREPLAYITGHKGFRRIELQVDERVLIPRPETEVLVAVIKIDRPCAILDVATGSGAVALALADELPDCSVLATDLSSAALAVATANAQRLQLNDRVTFAQSDLLAEVAGSFDAIAANLPYVQRAVIDGLQAEIAYEPRIALDGGADGLDLVRRLASQALAQLKPGGVIALEIGDDQGPATAEILRQSGFINPEIHQDLNARDRVVSAKAAK